MKTKETLLSNLFAILSELQQGSTQENRLKIELALLYDILGDDIPEEYWDTIEALI